jgi:hypothetical protein
VIDVTGRSPSWDRRHVIAWAKVWLREKLRRREKPRLREKPWR